MHENTETCRTEMQIHTWFNSHIRECVNDMVLKGSLLMIWTANNTT